MKNNSGFSLIELLVAVVIISLISTIVLINYRQGRERFTLQRSTHVLAQDIRIAQELAMRAEDFQGTVSRGGFGIHLTSATSSYVLFADCDRDLEFDISGGAASCAVATTANPFPEQLELRRLEGGVTIHSISPSSPSTIVFIPPDPGTRIRAGGVTTTAITITLGVIDDGVLATSTVSVNNAGLIDIR